MPTNILIVGAGRIGSALYELLRLEGFCPLVVDLVKDIDKTQKYTDVFACVPYHAIPEVAWRAAAMEANFYDFTEHVDVKSKVQDIYLDHFGTLDKFTAAIVNGCGVAPGLCNIIAADLMRKLKLVYSVSMCVGGVPQQKNINPLGYYNIWSTDGLWNLYFGNPVTYRWLDVMHNESIGVGLRKIKVMGEEYEAFLTGGTTVDDLLTYPCKVKGSVEPRVIPSVSYSTIRHPGHLDKILQLDALLGFRNNSELFKTVIDQLPRPEQEPGDMVLMSIEVSGVTEDDTHHKLTHEATYVPKYGLGAMPYCTALGGKTAFLNVLKRGLKGYVRQEELVLSC